MAIDVICPGCKKRFQVSEKFAGKQGPCPSCKTIINVPAKGEEVVVHAPEQFGPKGTSGQAVFKPIKRQQTRYSPAFLGTVAGGVVGVFVLSLILRAVFGAGGTPPIVMIIGAILIGIPLAMAGYTFLREQELEPYRGQELLQRSAICGTLYGLLWVAFSTMIFAIFGPEKLDAPMMLMSMAPFIALGGFVAFVSFDLEPIMAGIHFTFYFAVCVMLRLVLGFAALGGNELPTI